MADWTANSDFGALGRREPVVRTAREPAMPPEDGVRAQGFAASRAFEEELPLSASAALAEYNAAQDGPLAKARVAVWAAGGIVSLALIAGIGVWGYKLILREVMGLPVVEAAEGPMRVPPAEPGGEIVPQQGLAVNAIPAAGTAAPPSDVLMLAPPTPGLAEEDMEVVQTMAEAGEVMPAAPAAPAVATDALPPADATATLAAPAPAAEAAPAASPDPAAQAAAQLVSALLPADRPMTTEEILAFADQIAAQAAPPAVPAAPAQPAAAPAVPEAAPAPAAQVAAEAPVAAPVAASVAPVPLRPQPRPSAAPAQAAPAEATLSEAAPAPAASAAPAPAAQPAAASGIALTADLPAGTNLIQLGAFDSPEIAASEWTRLQGAFGEFLGPKERVIQETQSGGRTLYRLRALGFADRADARRLCAALTAEGADCIPVTVD